MQVLASTLPSLGVEPQQHRAPHLLRRLLGTSAEFELHDACSARRPALEKYIAQCFQRAYQAEVTEFAPLLLELRCGHSTSGVAGIRPAGRAPLFFEHYLDVPVEEVAGQLAGQPVARHEIVEICNLAALRPGACQLINIILAAALHGAGFRYAGFAVTAQLERLICKQHFVVQPVAIADPARLGSAAAQWGSYYASSPNVLLVDLPRSMPILHSHYLPSAIFQIYADTIQSLSNSLGAFQRVAVEPDTGAL